MNRVFIILAIFFSSIIYSQNTYTVSKSGERDFSTISEINNFNFNNGDIVSFKSGEEFSDATLFCESGVTYNTFGGSEKAKIGNPNLSGPDPTIEIKEKDVTLNNLLVYGYNNAKNVITYSANRLTVTDCEIIGGNDAHSKLTVGVRQTNLVYGTGHKFLRNKIHDLTYGIYLARPYDVEVAYNEMYDFYRVDGTMDHGGYAIGGDFISGLNDTWDSKYTFWVHHNNIYNFEYVALALGASRMLIEYNNIHHNLDERIYRGGVKHGSIGKIFDNTNVEIGGIGLIFRYNYIHDLVRRGEANYTYGVPSQWNFDNNTPNIVSTDNGTGSAVYLNAVSNNENGFGKDFGDQPQEKPDYVISGLGYGNFWVHNNVFYNCSNSILKRAYNRERGHGETNPFREDLGSYMINNTIINCAFRNYITKNSGVMMTEYEAQSPHTVVNNIIDFKNEDALAAGRWKEKELYLDYNTYLNQSGTAVNIPSYGDNKAAWYNGGSHVNKSTGSNEKYNSDPDWNNKSSTIFAANIGIEGTYIPDIRLKENGNAHNSGKDYSTIGDTYRDSYGTHQLGSDPTGRSFAYDLLGNFRRTNDRGALGIASGNNDPAPQQNGGLKVYLEAPFNDKLMDQKLFDSQFIPTEQPYNIDPWLLNQNNNFIYSEKVYIDWVIVELRESINSIIAQKTALLDAEGLVKNTDGTNFSLNGIESGSYHIVIKHRTHLAIMSSEKVEIKNGTPIEYNFTDNLSKSFGNNSMFQIANDKWAMFAGDGNSDGKINNLDFGEVANNIPASGYYNGDLNMDGVVSVLDYSLINKNLFKSSVITN